MTPYIDIHTHTGTQHTGVVSIYNMMLGATTQNTEPPQGSLYSIGIHPWDAANASQNREQLTSALRQACLNRNHPPVAIGESGLDLRPAYRASESQQREWFESQIAIAQEFGLPIIIHSVHATDQTLRIVEHTGVPIIIHAFTGSIQTAKRHLDAGHYLSFGFRSLGSPKNLEALKLCPTDRIFFESDDSPMSVEQLYDTACTLRPDINIEILKAEIIKNFEKITKCHLPPGSNAPICY